MGFPSCPICGDDLIIESQIFVEGTLGESHERCPQEHFSSDYTYGITKYTIGNKTFSFSYQDSQVKVSKVMGNVNEAIEEYKEANNE